MSAVKPLAKEIGRTKWTGKDACPKGLTLANAHSVRGLRCIWRASDGLQVRSRIKRSVSMRSTRPSSTIFFLFLTLFTTTIIARGADDTANEADEYDVKARVLRISLITGE